MVARTMRNRNFLPLKSIFANPYATRELLRTPPTMLKKTMINVFKVYWVNGAFCHAIAKFSHNGFSGRSLGGYAATSGADFRAVLSIHAIGNRMIRAPAARIRKRMMSTTRFFFLLIIVFTLLVIYPLFL